ncbi:MAG: hypothetical protein TREMPRED_000722 [Tremellales sp. Tagirdzhanova-0007]|nr:MAG: hypothetical protein TREMPRED_000722 [Tremellales sp. Tagirdzhanova-0007]
MPDPGLLALTGELGPPSSSSSGGVKRPVPDSSLNGPSKSKKPHPFFTGIQEPGAFLPSPPSLIHFVHLDAFASRSEPGPSKKIPVIFYDFDGTLIKPRSGAAFPSSRNDWAWWHPSVPARLKAEWEEGKHIVVISNQGDGREKIRKEWRAKLPLVAAKMPSNVPIRILAGLSKVDVYRKPNIGMFQVVEEVYRSKGFQIDLERSLFVGDAAGRVAAQGKRKDHSDTDLKFALNVGLKFLTPEEHFLSHPRPTYPIPPTGFHPAKLGNLAALPHIVPSNTSITSEEVEIVCFVGPPAAGKTSFFRKHFAHRYGHVNQDMLRSREKCLAVAEELLVSGRSAVVGKFSCSHNTNRNRETRAHWIRLAARLNVPIRLFHFLCPIELAKHNNMYRACYASPDEPVRELLPGSAFSGYVGQFEAPTLGEGFDQIRGVNFVFEGDDVQRRKWDMWMLEATW